MLQFDEYKVKLNNLAPTLEELGKALDLESAERELDMLQAESAADGFWNNLEKAQKVQQRIKNLQDKVDKQNKRRREWDDLMALCEMGNEFEDESLLPELEEGFAQLERDMEEARLQTLLTGGMAYTFIKAQGYSVGNTQVCTRSCYFSGCRKKSWAVCGNICSSFLPGWSPHPCITSSPACCAPWAIPPCRWCSWRYLPC